MLCASIGEKTKTAALAVLRALPMEVTFAEIRLDLLDDPSPEPFCAEAADRLVVTCRRPRDGGQFDGSEVERLAYLGRARRAGARFIDVEMDADESVAGDGRGVIRSFHDVTGTPPDLERVATELRRRRGEAWKLAVTARDLSDSMKVLACLERHRGGFACMAMGPAGLITRVLAEPRGSFLTFCAARDGAETAPGQVSAGEMLHHYRVRHLGRRPSIYGLLGTGIAHSLSPRLHNGWFARRAERCVYVPFDTTDLDDFMAFARTLPLSGWSVTAPFKEAISTKLDRLSRSARLAGCVNTVVSRNGDLVGYNTDVRALIGLIRHARGRSPVLVLGSGSTAKAACRALSAAGYSVMLCARRDRAARQAAADIRIWFVPWGERGSVRAGVIVNATSVGQGGRPGAPLAATALRVGQLVIDFPYGPRETDLVRAARARSCVVVDGKRILLEQARLQRRLFRN